jgi:sorbitol-specific phosphotransferase system component IIBC
VIRVICCLDTLSSLIVSCAYLTGAGGVAAVVAGMLAAAAAAGSYALAALFAIKCYPCCCFCCRYDLFKKYAAAEQETASAEEASNVLQGSRPAAPRHRNALQKLMGGE